MSAELQPISVTVNGQPQELAGDATVADLLRLLAVPVAGVAVECNRSVVRRADHEACRLQAGDQIEIVQFVGGG